MIKLGLPAHCISISTGARTIGVGARKIFDAPEFEILRISGIAATPDLNLSSDFSEEYTRSIPLTGFAYAIGEWTAVAGSHVANPNQSSKYIVLNDEYGYSPIFYSLLPGQGLIISDSFHGVVHELRRNGLAASLDISTYLASVTTKDSRFSNPFVSRTFSDSIQILPPHKFLYVSDQAVSIHDRSDLLEHSTDNSRNLVKAGVEFISGTLARLARLADFKHSLLLSGGVDSRIVLALLMHAGAENKFALRVNDPRLYKNKYSSKVFEKDFFISHQLGDDLGLEWQEVRESFRIDTSLEESMTLAQAYSSNFSNVFTPATHHPIHKNPEVSLRGGGGEPIKGAGFLSLKREIEAHHSAFSTSGTSTFEQFKGWYLSNALIKTRFKGEVGDALGELEAHFDARNFDDAMPHFYQQTRNRTHFGHAKFSSSSNLFPFQPLSNSYFYEVAESMEKTDLRNFELTKEIFQIAGPELLRYPFESHDATKKLTLSPGRSILSDSNVMKSHFDRIAATRVPTTTIKQPGTFEDRFLSNKSSALISLCRTLAHDIEESFPEYKSSLKSAHTEAIAAIELGVLSPSTTAARMRAARDVVSPTVDTGVAVSFATSERINDSIELVGIKDPGLSSPVKIQNPAVLPQVVLNPMVAVSENVIEVTANPEISRSFELEFAFYLLANGRPVVKIQYQDQSHMEFVLPDGYSEATLSVKVFARHSGQRYPCAIATSGITGEGS